MNPTIKTLLSHRSIRKFTSETIPNDWLDAIIQSGIQASSSSFMQVTSIIRVNDPEKRVQLATLAGNQKYVQEAAEFLVFCIDYDRHKSINANVDTENAELTLIGAVDAGIMAQNCMIAAESLGLGGVYIGGIRNNAQSVHDLLSIPKNCSVLFGLCLGFPSQDPSIKPRLKQKVIVHQDQYQPMSQQDIDDYDHELKQYYQQRSTNKKVSNWSTDIPNKLTKESRPHMMEYLHNNNLNKK
ncbi:oxygen-insensitive NADPH nitroreductase [Vibrio sp.]|nr:oxygen-insensitive NADPH nitroreductase [Vibrio sp.]